MNDSMRAKVDRRRSVKESTVDTPQGGVRYFMYAKDAHLVICTVCGSLVHKPSTELHTATHLPGDRHTAATERKSGQWQVEKDYSGGEND